MINHLKNRNVQTILIACGWYLALFPGRLGFDSAEAIRMIQRNQSTDWWGASFFWFLRVTTLNGQTIAIAALIQISVLLFSLSLYVHSLPTSRKNAQNALFVIAISPFFGFFGLGISHDVFFVSGILLILREENFRIFKSERHSSRRIELLAVAMILVNLSMTKIGLLIFVLYCILMALRKNLLKAAVLFITGVVFFIVSSIGITPQASGYYLWPAFADLKCIAQHETAEISPQQWSWLESYATVENWKKQISCSSMDQAVEALGFESNIEISANTEFFRNFISIVSQNPAIVVMAHINRSRVALPPPFFPIPNNQVNLNSEVPVGQGTNTALQSGPEVLHPSIDEPSMQVQKGRFVLVEQLVQIPTFLINQASWFWGWGGMWLWAVGYYFLKRGDGIRIPRLVFANWPTMILHSTLVLLAPTSLPRYVMSTILCGLIVLTIIILEKAGERKVNDSKEMEAKNGQ
jgi:hypothetical protein